MFGLGGCVARGCQFSRDDSEVVLAFYLGGEGKPAEEGGKGGQRKNMRGESVLLHQFLGRRVDGEELEGTSRELRESFAMGGGENVDDPIWASA